MFLDQIEIKNFRGIRRLELKLDETTVLIGENNTGKSTILAALEVCLSRRLGRRGGAFSEYDYRLPTKDSQPSDSDGIEITLRFLERSEGEWPDEVVQALGEAVQVSADDKQAVTFRVRSQFDDLLGDFVTAWTFLNPAGDELVGARNPALLDALRQLVPVFYLSALRDSAQEFTPRGQFWRPFVRFSKMEPDVRQELEEELAHLNQRVLDANESFGAIEERLSNTKTIVPLATDDPVGIEAIPSRVFDILSRTQVMLSSVTGARLPIGRHGEGTQSLAVVCLFDAFLQSRMTDTYRDDTTPILALEEPEAHLHPAAIHSVATLLQGLSGQKLLTSHSGDLVGACSITSLRRLRRKNGEITVHHLTTGILDEDEMRKVNYHIRSNRGSVLFARCWLLVEGEADRLILEGCAEAMNRNLAYEGVSFIEYRQIGVGVEALTTFAESMGIEWHLVADNDKAGDDYVKAAEKQLAGRQATQHISQLQHGTLEVFLSVEGYGYVYKSYISQNKASNVTASQGSLEYWEQVSRSQANKAKIPAAVEVANEIRRNGVTGVPSQLADILNCAIHLAEEARNG